MKHLFKTAAVTVAAIILTACSVNANQGEGDNPADTTQVAAEQNSPVEPIFTEEGVSPVVLGANVKDLPEAVDGLYARKEYVKLNDEGSDEEIGLLEVEGWYFYDKDNNLMFTAEENEGTIYRVIVHSPNIKTAQGIHVGMKRSEALAIKGTKLIEPSPEADYEIYSLEYGKISMNLDFENNNEIIDMSVVDWNIVEQ